MIRTIENQEVIFRMAALFESDSEEEEFLGFGQETNQTEISRIVSQIYLFQV